MSSIGLKTSKKELVLKYPTEINTTTRKRSHSLPSLMFSHDASTSFTQKQLLGGRPTTEIFSNNSYQSCETSLIEDFKIAQENSSGAELLNILLVHIANFVSQISEDCFLEQHRTVLPLLKECKSKIADSIIYVTQTAKTDEEVSARIENRREAIIQKLCQSVSTLQKPPALYSLTPSDSIQSFLTTVLGVLSELCPNTNNTLLKSNCISHAPKKADSTPVQKENDKLSVDITSSEKNLIRDSYRQELVSTKGLSRNDSNRSEKSISTNKRSLAEKTRRLKETLEDLGTSFSSSKKKLPITIKIKKLIKKILYFLTQHPYFEIKKTKFHRTTSFSVNEKGLIHRICILDTQENLIGNVLKLTQEHLKSNHQDNFLYFKKVYGYLFESAKDISKFLSDYLNTTDISTKRKLAKSYEKQHLKKREKFTKLRRENVRVNNESKSQDDVQNLITFLETPPKTNQDKTRENWYLNNILSDYEKTHRLFIKFSFREN